MVKDLQALRPNEMDDMEVVVEENVVEEPISRRKMVRAMDSRRTMKNTETLDAVFRRRYNAMMEAHKNEGLGDKNINMSTATINGKWTLSRGTLKAKAMEKKRNTALRGTINR